MTIGFHGCDRSVADKVLNGEDDLRSSINDYDWLGHGIYFWERDAKRALQFAKEKKNISEPAVVGALIHPMNCLDLRCQEAIDRLRDAYGIISQNEVSKNSCLRDNYFMRRDLDCLVIETASVITEGTSRQKYDSVIGTFEEGGKAYPGAGFREKTHTQVCVRNPECVLGYFLPRKQHMR